MVAVSLKKKTRGGGRGGNGGGGAGGEGGGRYLRLPGRPSLGSSGRAPAHSAVSLVDEWIGVAARLQWTPAAELAWGPVQTVSVSEGGYERIYQGTSLLLTWPVGLGPGKACEIGRAHV